MRQGRVVRQGVPAPCLLVALSLVAMGCQGEATLRLKKGLEPQLEQILATEPGELPDGWEWQSAAVLEDRVEVSFGPKGGTPASCSQAACCLELASPEAAGGQDVLAGPFALRLTMGHCTGLPEMDQRLLGGIGSRIQKWASEPGTESPWQVLEADLGWGQAMGRLLSPRWVMLTALVLLLSLLVVDRKPLKWPVAGVICVLTAACWLLSWYLVPHATLHDNHHGYTFLLIAQSQRPPAHHTLSSFLSVMQALVHALTWLGADGDEAFYGVNTLFMALCGPLLGLWVYCWTGKRAAATLAALMWVFSPLALRLGPTDSFFSWCTLLFGSSALLWARGLKLLPTNGAKGALYVALAAALAVLLGQAHVMALLLVPAVLPLGLTLVLPSGRRQWIGLVATVLAVCISLVPQALAIVQGAAQREGALFVELGNLVSLASWAQRMTWNVDWVSPLVPVLALLGLVVLWRKRKGLALLAGLTFAMVLGTELLVAMCLTFHVSSETPQVFLAMALASVGGWEVIHRLGERARAARKGCKSLLGLALLAGLFLPPSDILRFLPPSGQEYRFLRDEVFPYLRQQGASELLFVGSERIEGFHRMPVPLEWLAKELPGVAVRSSGASWRASEQEASRGHGPRFIYTGLSCVETLPEYPICEAVPCSRTERIPAQRAAMAGHCQAELSGLPSHPVLERNFANVSPCFLCVGYPLQSLWGTLSLLDRKD